MKRAIFLLAALLIIQAGAYAQKQVILNAMKDELARSVEQLKLDGEPGPYFVSYLLQDTYSLRIIADSGAVTANSENRNRTLRVGLRVGSYDLDNSNYLGLTGLTSGAAGITRLPLDDDYDALRRQIWQATDRSYKAALDTLTKKKATLQNTVITERLPDFIKSEAASSLAAEISFTAQRERWSQLVDQLSKLFLNQPRVPRSRVDLSVQIFNSYYVNSEGTTAAQPLTATRLSVSVTSQANDGMPLSNFRIYTAARPEALPEKARLDGDIKLMIAELLAARDAPLAEDYSGPVLFVEQAAGELFSQGFASLLAARRIPLSDSAQTSALLSRYGENPFLSKLNMKVASSFLSLKAVPKLKNYGQKELLGSYEVDEEGIPSRDVSLIENGILKNLLSSRSPVKGAEQSNGHARGGSAAPSIIQVTSTNKRSYQQLKQELINAAKEEGLPFGYMIRGITPVAEAMTGDTDLIDSLLMSQRGAPEPNQFRLTRPYLAFRVYPDGKEEPVRGVDFGSINISAFRNIVATSDDETVYDFPVSTSGALSGLGSLASLLGAAGVSSQDNYATVIIPSLLITGIDVRKSSGNYPKLPIVSYPAK